MAVDPEYMKAIAAQRQNTQMDFRPILALEQIADAIVSIRDDLSDIRRMMKDPGRSGGAGFR